MNDLSVRPTDTPLRRETYKRAIVLPVVLHGPPYPPANIGGRGRALDTCTDPY